MDVALKSEVYIRWIENHENAAGVFGLQRGKGGYPIDLVSISVADGEPVGLWWCRIYFSGSACRRTDMRVNLREVDGDTAEGVEWWNRVGSRWSVDSGGATRTVVAIREQEDVGAPMLFGSISHLPADLTVVWAFFERIDNMRSVHPPLRLSFFFR